MFDRYNYNGSKTVTVIENRAPTDESVKLLREMEEKAREQILKAIPIDNNVFNGVVIERMSDSFDFNKEIIVKFKLNGEEFLVKESVSSRQLEFDRNMALQKAIEGIAKTISDEIAVRVAHSLIGSQSR